MPTDSTYYGPCYRMVCSVPDDRLGWRIGGAHYPKTCLPFWYPENIISLQILGKTRLEAVCLLDDALAGLQVLPENIYE